ncbi:MAG: bifunctional UDP-N-acetylglucosamine diphosphorylase/glucosamine-1-phosphate N-acetyltransferase GlmU [Trichlorobacter sp.]|nr:bifunctional UDP-N-acetylglucosamine diphosphorylase/glucosamine-1-phosphate N-acetyltransferase GlmU [Trichlorobacter sp.]
MPSTSAIILAAGKGTRMKSATAKVLHETAGRPLLAWPMAAAQNAGVNRIVIVAGHQAEQVQQCFSHREGVTIALQKEQLGTGHAVACALPSLADQQDGTVLLLCGDTPLLTAETVQNLVAQHNNSSVAITVLTAKIPDPFGYGRIVRDGNGQVLRIVEQKDATDAELAINEINSGIYCINLAFLREYTGKISNDNAQGEYYLTDLVALAVANKLGCNAMLTDDYHEVMGVNDRIQLAEAASVLRRRINKKLMLSGVTLIDPEHTYIDADVTIGCDTVIWPGCVLRGNTVIGDNCLLESNVQVVDCQIGQRVHLKNSSVLEESKLADEVVVGPMAHLRPSTELAEQVKIGNFVETKKIKMGKNSKASHLTYLGDATVGSDVNIGCGTITCNYDGKNKYQTIIGDRVFIGSDVQLVAPVKVGSGALVAAGTTVTVDVPENALSLSRTPQLNKEGWCLKKRGND